MTSEQNKERERLLVEEVLNKGNLSLLDDLLSPNFVYHGIDWKEIKGIDAYKKMIKGLRTAYPDFHATIEDIIADDNSVWIKVKITGTHTGEYRGLAPTGKKFVMEAVPRYRIVDGKIVEGWSVWNPLGYFRQLGY